MSAPFKPAPIGTAPETANQEAWKSKGFSRPVHPRQEPQGTENPAGPHPVPSPVPMASSLEPRGDEASFPLLPEGPSGLGS